jgi:sterol-4alpha-carboxylate 3-dehydrogenase (decarboxylating)
MPNTNNSAKAEAEELVLSANDPPNFLTCAIRPAGIIGEGDTMAIYHMMNLYREGRHRIQVGPNDNLFDFTYVENVAHGHLLAARALLVTRELATPPLDHEKVDGEAFFITNGSPIYFWDFPRCIWKYMGNTEGLERTWTLPRDVGMFLGYMSEVVFGLLRKPPTLNRQRIIYSCMTRYYDITKARKRLNYEPLVSLEEGIRRGVRWSLEQEKEKAALKAAQ